MEIDTYSKRILILNRVKRIEKSEVFFEVPGHKDYALSNFGRLHKRTETGAWHSVPMEEHGMIDCYEVDGKTVPVLTLMKIVFFYGLDVSLTKSRGMYPYKLEDIKVNDSKEKNRLLLFTDRGINEWLDVKYRGIYIRATSPAFKIQNPQYENTTMSEEWRMNPNKCKQYLLDISYYYPTPLEVDKDLPSFGVIDEYREGNVVLLPKYINNMFTKRNSQYGYGIKQKITQNGDIRYTFTYPRYADSTERASMTFDNYAECLNAARQKRWEYIHWIVEKEWELGYLPEYILELMETLASETIRGNVKLLEPSDETLQILGAK